MKLERIVVFVAMALIGVTVFATIASAGEITGGRQFAPDGSGGWLVEGTPASGRELVGIADVLRDEAREQARAEIQAILDDIDARPSANPEIGRLEAALQAVITILEN